jgi:hypothetical protein
MTLRQKPGPIMGDSSFVTGASALQDFLHSPDAGPTITTSIIFVCIAIIVLGSVIAVQWRKRRQVEIQADLTKGMVDAGMSADEIVSVLKAATDADGPRVFINRRSPGNPSSQSPSKATSDSKA